MSVLLDDERLEPLGKNMKIVVSDSHPFGTDAILLADFADIHKGDRVCDLGTGCGIIPLLWHKGGKAKHISAVDIQPKACSQLKKSLEINGITEGFDVYNADLRELKGVIEFGKLDVVTMNPPYKPVGTGIESISDAEKIARHETMCNLDDLVESAKRLLRFGGKLCLCHRPERLCDIMTSMRNGGIEPKRVRFVSQTVGKAPWLVLVEGKNGSKPHLTVEKELYIKNPDGSDSEEMLRIFGDYREGEKNA
ncbi:MAG: methyltransferase [Clostridia bacterium]|nr:methyltransferase [Clostridia bacterium]